MSELINLIVCFRLSNYKKQNLFFRLPAFFKNFKDLDSTELKKNDNRDSNQVLKENQKVSFE